MNLHIEDTLQHYEKLFTMVESKRENFFRYTMMRPFERMWNIINVPMVATQLGGYDVIMASKMLGFLDGKETSIGQVGLEKLKQIDINHIAEKTTLHCIDVMAKAGLEVKAETLHFGAYLADPQKLAYTKGYTGFGGIPGYIQLIIYPNDYNIPKIPSIIAHEFHHNVRFSYFDWDHGNVTVGDYIIIEGLAESFASALYGKEMSGPWVNFDEEDLMYSIEVIRQALDIKGFAEVSSYMFGDDIAKEQGYHPVGLSYAAGYAVGYHTVQEFLKKTGVTIYEATRLSSAEIIKDSKVF
ncbi:hypothetical protein E0485_24230 [Paenibacillus albiflavus]|uniref:DUF2268 domain-containing protein n=1 Tax=Paenibacillus albiflavus TaxID=2545760 RepID=A0A4R4DWH7_9BACL|nr:DUF2268 domain-containing protein [Paenibacillus albiflavus]TCZ68609.1 hypothetical protein E0485_24230 [Paenibacillus albiflavus]